jgi:hypothetical protein
MSPGRTVVRGDMKVGTEEDLPEDSFSVDDIRGEAGKVVLLEDAVRF